MLGSQLGAARPEHGRMARTRPFGNRALRLHVGVSEDWGYLRVPLNGYYKQGYYKGSIKGLGFGSFRK